MKAKIFVTDFENSNKAIEYVKNEASKYGNYVHIDPHYTLPIIKNKDKYAYYRNEVDSSTKSLIIEMFPSWDFEYFSMFKIIDGEPFNKIRVNRPMIGPKEMYVNIFFISYGFSFESISPYYLNMFEIIDLKF